MNRVWPGMALGACLWLALVSPANAEDTAVAERFPPASISSLERAELALAAVEQERVQIHAEYAAAEAVCHQQFFVSRCIERAKEERRQALGSLEEIELAARRFQRVERARKRDAEMMERRAAAEEKAARAAAMEPAPSPTARPEPPAEPQGKPRAQVPKPAPTPEEEQAAARQRAENEASYARKVEAARARQEAVRARKEEKLRRQSGIGAEAGGPTASPAAPD